MEETTQEIDFNGQDENTFFYTSDKKIAKLDDEYLLAKIQERYPELNQNAEEYTLKQVLIVILNDSQLFKDFYDKYDLDTCELIKLLYRHYEFIFSKCFLSKVQKTIKKKSHAKQATKRTKCIVTRASRKVL